jgi:hypothetical protein
LDPDIESADIENHKHNMYARQIIHD